MASETHPGTNRQGWALLTLAALLAAASLGVARYEQASSSAPEAGVPGSAGAAGADMAALRRTAEAAPDDARAWGNLAVAHAERGEFTAAVAAFRRATMIDDSQAALWSALGEALVMASQSDPLPPAALDAFKKALALDPKDTRARYFLAVKKDLDKDHAGAIADWLALLADTPPGAPWEADLLRTIEQVGKTNGIAVASRIAAVNAKRPAGAPATAPRGPSADDAAAAASMTSAEQRTMIEGMVGQLEARLASEPRNPDGWVMLMRSRMALGEPAKAKAALEAAIRANPGEAGALRRQAEALGIQ